MDTDAERKPKASEQPAPNQREPWNRADRINFIGVAIAFVVAVIGAVPVAASFYQSRFDASKAVITSISDGQSLPSNRIAVSGTSRHISDDSDLWLTASGDSDQVYPIAELRTNGMWSATEKQVCFRLGRGPQRLDVWMSPDTGDGAFVAYMQANNTTGFNSVPAGFVKEAQVTLYIQHAFNQC